MNKKHSNFMREAYIESSKSSDNRTKVGAIIVRNDVIVSKGYNDMPNNCSGLPWSLEEGLMNKHLYVVHAELNAILSAKQDLTGCTLYVTLFPCNECAKAIIQAGIANVVYDSNKFSDSFKYQASKLMFKKAKVKIRRCNL